ncbi:MAG: hypothetical protein JWN58_998 [Gammaproteobacteria bacterium]|nr:hypothetical protein [Gammaproteobacteria bacterium]
MSTSVGCYFVIEITLKTGQAPTAISAARCTSKEECIAALSEITPRLSLAEGLKCKTFCSDDPKYRELAFPTLAMLREKLSARLTPVSG